MASHKRQSAPSLQDVVGVAAQPELQSPIVGAYQSAPPEKRKRSGKVVV